MQNDGSTIALIIAAVLVLALIAWALMRKRRRDTLRTRYGEEYDRTIEEHGGRKGEANLLERERRVSGFTIRPLDAREQERFGREWHDVKALFVDAPREAVLRGDRLLTEMLRTRGYPMADFDRLYEDLTVDHADVARHYRAGHDIAVSADPTTEEMRRALNHYEELFSEMMRGGEETVRGDDRDRVRDIERPEDGTTIPVSRRVEQP